MFSDCLLSFFFLLLFFLFNFLGARENEREEKEEGKPSECFFSLDFFLLLYVADKLFYFIILFFSNFRIDKEFFCHFFCSPFFFLFIFLLNKNIREKQNLVKKKENIIQFFLFAHKEKIILLQQKNIYKINRKKREDFNDTPKF